MHTSTRTVLAAASGIMMATAAFARPNNCPSKRVCVAYANGTEIGI
jgi:hypothetical protein